MDEDTPTLKPRRIQNQNVVHRLERRRICSGRPGAHWYRVRCFHQNLFPNFTVVNVEKPPCFLRKFSPDGRCFIAFSSDQTSLEVVQRSLTVNFVFFLTHISAENIIFYLIFISQLSKAHWRTRSRLAHSPSNYPLTWDKKDEGKTLLQCLCSSSRYMNTRAVRQLRTCWEAKRERLF